MYEGTLDTSTLSHIVLSVEIIDFGSFSVFSLINSLYTKMQVLDMYVYI